MNPLPWDDRWYAWRLDREVYSETWDSGLGSKRDGGRWNTPGRRVVYASVDPSTAILEVAAHGSFDALDQEPYVLTCFEITHDASVRIVQTGRCAQSALAHPDQNLTQPAKVCRCTVG